MIFKNYLLNQLKKNGITKIFGVPGRENEEIQFNEVDGIDFITTRVEFTASVAGDVAGRLTNKTQVVFSTMGPGATNLTTGIASAMLNRSPVVYLTAQLESDDLHYNITHQCVDQRTIFSPITKYSVELEKPSDIILELKKAFKIANTEPCGPVHISIPTNFFCSEIGQCELEEYKLDKGLASIIDEDKLEAMRKLINGSTNPIALIGTEVNREESFKEVLSFSDTWDIPFITSANVKGISNASNSPLNLGSASCYMEGIINFPALDYIFGESDLIILIGYQYVDDLLPKMWERGLKKNVILINLVQDNFLEKKLAVTYGQYGSIKENLSLLITDSKKLNRKDYSIVKDKTANVDEEVDSDALSPFQVVKQVNNFMDNGILVTDIGYYRHHAILFTQSTSPFSFVSDTGISSFGSGLPSAIAAKLSYPEKDVILVCGDGGFHSGSGDLATLVKYKLPILIIVMNNNSYELIKLYQHKNKKIYNYNTDITTLGSVDFVKLAEANNCNGIRVHDESELSNAINDWDKTKPLIIETNLQYKDAFEISF